MLRMKCSHCGSEQVLLDAWAEWDVQQQEWVLQNVFQQAYCETCDGETTINEVEYADCKDHMALYEHHH